MPNTPPQENVRLQQYIPQSPGLAPLPSYPASDKETNAHVNNTNVTPRPPQRRVIPFKKFSEQKPHTRARRELTFGESTSPVPSDPQPSDEQVQSMEVVTGRSNLEGALDGAIINVIKWIALLAATFIERTGMALFWNNLLVQVPNIHLWALISNIPANGPSIFSPLPVLTHMTCQLNRDTKKKTISRSSLKRVESLPSYNVENCCDFALTRAKRSRVNTQS